MWKEKSRKLDFWKFHCQNEVGELSKYALKISFFLTQNFFSKSSRIFLWVAWICPRYLKGPLDLVQRDSKKLGICGASNKFYARKSQKSWIFENFNVKMELASSQDMPWKPHFLTHNFFSKVLQHFVYGSYLHIRGV